MKRKKYARFKHPILEAKRRSAMMKTIWKRRKENGNGIAPVASLPESIRLFAAFIDWIRFRNPQPAYYETFNAFADFRAGWEANTMKLRDEAIAAFREHK